MPPSPFVIQWVTALRSDVRAGGRALDVAAGSGRHVGVLARAGFTVFAVDRSLDALRAARAAALDEGAVLRGWCADLTSYPLPARWFDLVLVTRYLDRSFFGSLRDTVAPGGVVLYETFTVHQAMHDRGPRSPDHLLRPGELPGYFEGFEVLYDAEQRSPEAVARLVARRRA